MSKTKNPKEEEEDGTWVPGKRWLRGESVIGVESHEVAEIHNELLLFLALNLHLRHSQLQQMKPISNLCGVEGGWRLKGLFMLCSDVLQRENERRSEIEAQDKGPIKTTIKVKKKKRDKPSHEGFWFLQPHNYYLHRIIIEKD